MHVTLLTTLLLTLQVLALALPSYTHTSKRLPSSSLHPRQNATNPSSCDLSSISQPPHTMTPPSSDMTLVLIALGRGTQNYTCAPNAPTPSPIGAVATLYDASCAVATSNAKPADGKGRAGGRGRAKGPCVLPQSAPSIGNHFFSDNTTPVFSIPSLGITALKKAESAPAPDPSVDVPWLLLSAVAEGTTSPVKSIYRLHTKGGVAPGSCEGVAEGETVTVGYEAEYWIYA
ncbi:uncharacterized protein EI97DRAFT_29632 [Westerdykella ornata]|uniref:Malate dehydrogenase n=1 Tax=Westerdykella ornata TaxID=318751 RepID=A0A6A6JZ22_WESOR|nr:uncharacterized protein EI97DRAFT_29632 [Westerdykella ornata]KAF2281455.1 hypothetical protein EI97DRAFT_29632 [Westerdykella ornata]